MILSDNRTSRALHATFLYSLSNACHAISNFAVLQSSEQTTGEMIIQYVYVKML